MPEAFDPRITEWLAKFFLWVFGLVGTGFVAFCLIMYRSIRAQQELRVEFKHYMQEIDKKHDFLTRELTVLRSDVSRLEAKMLTTETLKRIELFLTSISPQDRESGIARAIHLEITAKDQR